ncbi:carboxylating nicotinate-nucleotide diphosphorylase [Clostridium gasigenes]|uniref:Probable nicotinate-nucleotide pyrophosphorylase [carboxylating] n=1 Tax=Clostridium gasigenes TaxID=94869 RepID=A0A7X0SE26_9CLOT|nr:carboxylating nicotinate-nucleotide diphosphorylase [Clostridium gasigenes]MBB6714653.1 carboxylating nicotinate-nucleotide diphosphorylase [Clostridium gasigenes]
MLNYLIIDDIILNSLKEDVPFGDITTTCIVTDDEIAQATVICKEDGILCGLPVFSRVFHLLGNVEFTPFIKEGTPLICGDEIGILKGNAKNILIGERVALNLIQRMSGIATLTKKYSDILEGFKTEILDTRKTTPLLRIIEKYAVKIGGGKNHRYSLSDGILIKDNHISYAGSITNAVSLAKENCSFVRKIEVEAETKEDVLEALASGVDIIMLDNMSPKMVKEMVLLIDKKALIECSGNITLETVCSYAECGVDYISSGSLTHSFKVLDISLKNLSKL